MLNLEKMIDLAERKMLDAQTIGDELERKRWEEIIDALEELKWLRDFRREGLWNEKEAAFAALIGASCAFGFLAACGAITVLIWEILIGGRG